MSATRDESDEWTIVRQNGEQIVACHHTTWYVALKLEARRSSNN